MSWKWSVLLVLVTFTFLMVAYYGRAIHMDMTEMNRAQQLHIPLRTIKSNYAVGKNSEKTSNFEKKIVGKFPIFPTEKLLRTLNKETETEETKFNYHLIIYFYSKYCTGYSPKKVTKNIKFLSNTKGTKKICLDKKFHFFFIHRTRLLCPTYFAKPKW